MVSILKKKLLFMLISIIISMLGLSACQSETKNETRVVLTTGFKENEIFRIEKTSCTIPEIMLYLTNTKNQYETTYGEKIWEVSYDGETLEANIKETVLARIARIKALNLLAAEREVYLSEEEKNKAAKAADIYFESLTDKEKEILEVNKELILKMYEEYALAEKIYDFIISDINPEISDDEARTITIQHILIKTYSVNEQGEQLKYTEEQKDKAYKKAFEALKRARNDENFESLIAEYSEDENSTYSFGKGSIDPVFEEAAFNLGTNEISSIVETGYGYHIIKCISTFDRSETDRNKIKIVEQQRKSEFNKVYSDFVQNLTKNIDEKKWKKVSFIKDKEVTTDSFFEVYHSVFDKDN